MAGLMSWKKKCFKVGTESVQKGFLLERKGKVISCAEAKDGKGTITNYCCIHPKDELNTFFSIVFPGFVQLADHTLLYTFFFPLVLLIHTLL